MFVFFNGEFIEEEDCKISPYDRGFLFADGVYEVVKYTGKRFFEFDSHLMRLKTGLEFLKINFPGVNKLSEIGYELIKRNNLTGMQSILYIQITRGESNPREHLFPGKDTLPTILVNVKGFSNKQIEKEIGISAILTEDFRWSKCCIKTVSLLPNVLALQKARDNNASEAIFVRDGYITEGTHTNFFAVKDGCLLTPPLSDFILPGITRKIIIKLCREINFPVFEENISPFYLHTLDEFMIVSTKADVTPVVRIDDINNITQVRRIVKTCPGAFTLKIQRVLDDYINQ